MAVIIAQAIEDYVSDIDGAENLTKIVLCGFYFHAAFYLILGAAEFYVVFASVYAENKYELMMAALNSIALGLVPLIEDTVGNRRSSESVRDWTSNLRGSPCELGLDSCEPIENIDVLGDTAYMALVILAVVAGVSFFVVALVMMREFGWRTFYRIGSDPHKRALLERMRMFDVVRTVHFILWTQLTVLAALQLWVWVTYDFEAREVKVRRAYLPN